MTDILTCRQAEQLEKKFTLIYYDIIDTIILLALGKLLRRINHLNISTQDTVTAD